MTHLSDEQFRIFMETIKSLAPDIPTDDSKSKGSLRNCNIRFYGQRDHDAVEEFITGVETYKEVEQISDADALKGITLLFDTTTLLWWKGVRRDIKTWEDVLTTLRDHFSPTKPAYQIYMELFDNKQQHNEAIDTFICEKRALLAKLPEDRHTEETELDFVYGMLLTKYKEKIPRHEVKSFKDLLEKGRIVERTGGRH